MSTQRLLVVDDSKVSRMMIGAIVKKLRPEWEISEAISGDEALAIIAEAPPTLVSMDVNMPGINGVEAAGRIRAHHPDIRIVLCTANIQDAVKQAAERAGIKFVAKPITPAAIEQMVALFES